MTPRRDPLPDPLWKLDLHGSTPDRDLDRVRQEIVLRQRHGQSPILIIMGRYWPPENRRNYSELGFIYL